MGNLIIHEDFAMQSSRKGEAIIMKFKDISEDGTELDTHVFSISLEDAQAHAHDVLKKATHVEVATEMPKGPRPVG